MVNVTNGTYIILPTPEYDGYKFKGWYTNLNDEYPVTSPYRVHESQKLYAKWEAGPLITGTKIYTLNDLAKVANNLSGTYVLMNDINCDGIAIPIIGTSSSNAFSGVFEGQGYTISNFSLSTGQYMGLFGYNTGTIRNLNIDTFDFTVTSVSFSATMNVGGIAGYSTGIIEKCSAVNGNIDIKLNQERHAGLIVGESKGQIINCYAKGNVKLDQQSNNGSYARAGGIAGVNRGLIDNCFANAYVSAYGYNKTYVSSSSHGMSGIIVGANESEGSINNCWVAGHVEKGNFANGDIAGHTGGSITNCYRLEGTTIPNINNFVGTQQTASIMSKETFYSVTLGWDPDFWDYSNVDIANGIYPTLIQK